ncbi:MAG: xerD 4, partial [Streptosporangiaceae bacterium]|nr:xerD 4 [Streptosporangiaceae bacterium]
MTGQRSGTAATPARGGTAARPTQAWRVALTWPRPWAWRPRPDGYLPYLLEDPARAAACLAEDWTVRASINGAGGPLSYDAAHHWWEGYCAAAGVEIDIHQLRHAHATELISSGVSI